MSRCLAHKKNGERCKRDAIRGGTVCPMHGGSAPQVKEAAELRLASVRDSALFLLAHRCNVEMRAVQKLGAAAGIPPDAIEYRDLLATVKDLTTQVELLAGRATDRIAITEAQGLVHAVIVYSQAFVPIERRDEYTAGLPSVLQPAIEAVA